MGTATLINKKIRSAPDIASDDPLTLALRRLTERTPDEIARDREAARRLITPGRSLPEGKTLFEFIGGAWPGDETDEEIEAALERLS